MLRIFVTPKDKTGGGWPRRAALRPWGLCALRAHEGGAFRPGWGSVGRCRNLARATQVLGDSHPCQNPPPSLESDRLAGKLPLGEGGTGGGRGREGYVLETYPFRRGGSPRAMEKGR
jgi:hypothetical protein